MQQEIHATQASVLTAYARWRKLKVEYRSARKTVMDKRKKLILDLKRDLVRARTHFEETRATWGLLVRFSGVRLALACKYLNRIPAANG